MESRHLCSRDGYVPCLANAVEDLDQRICKLMDDLLRIRGEILDCRVLLSDIAVKVEKYKVPVDIAR